MLVPLVATFIIAVLLYKLLFSSSKQDFWKKHGVRQIDISPAASKLDLILGRKSWAEIDNYVYSQLDPSEKFAGIIEMSQPVLLLNDIELMKKVLIKEFDHFVDRRMFFSKHDGSLYKMLGNLMGDEWKGVRGSVSPTFTTGRIRRMMEYFNAVGIEWVQEFTTQAHDNSTGSVTVDVLNAVNLYTVEVISSTVFGMTANVIKNPDSKFSQMANRLAQFNGSKLLLRMFFPWFSHTFKQTVIDMEALSFFEKILDEALKARVSGKTKRNDFLQLMIEAKKGELKMEKDELIGSIENENKHQYLTDEIVNAQSVVFFFGGYSSTSNFITFALYSLALYPEIQKKLRKEVGKIAKDDGHFDYDDVGQLVYLDKVVCEVLRKFPIVTRLERVCTKEYKDAEYNLTIPKGAVVGTPIEKLHNDKDFYENPEMFDPEHFSPEKKAERNPYAFMPFGMGNRNCIGLRFALIEIKSALAHMVSGFKIEPTSKTPRPLQSERSGVQVIPPKNLELKLTPIKNK